MCYLPPHGGRHTNLLVSSNQGYAANPSYKYPPHPPTLLPQARLATSKGATPITASAIIADQALLINQYALFLHLPSSSPATILDRKIVMEMKKVACAVLVAASAATVAIAAEGPAPAPTSASAAAFPAVGAVLGASVLSFFAYYLQ
ncbi:unnamed protein product [Urochloa humidicola]